jgi:curved DNA-binding protein CbpA
MFSLLYMKLCDHPDCQEEGAFPAPKSRHNLRDYYYFCLDHVREYNKQWDYFDGYNQEQIYVQQKLDSGWDRPTWKASISLKLEQRLHDFVSQWSKETKDYKEAVKTPLSKELHALQTLGLNTDADEKTIKSRYRELVKRYHPDKNPDNPKAADRFKVIAEAYMILQNKGQNKSNGA